MHSEQSVVPASADRVRRHTRPRVLRRIRDATRASIAFHAEHPERIERRLRQLDREWDIERILQTNASALVVAGSALAVLKGRRWIGLPAVVGAFLLQHAVQGWCPPLPVLRALGVRTAREIEAERYALMVIRGDFDDVESSPDAAVSATRRL